MDRARHYLIVPALLLLLAITASNIGAVSPSPDAIEKWRVEGLLEEKLSNWMEFKQRGGCSPAEHSPFTKKDRSGQLALAPVPDTANVLVILVEFTDWPASGGIYGSPADFDSILFSNRDTDAVSNPTGSMTDFYLENSYGNFYVKGEIFGWYTMPQTYAYYENLNDGLGYTGRELATHAVERAAQDIDDFTRFDRNGDGDCDGLVIIHAGPGAEAGAYGIWSHKATLTRDFYFDGVTLRNYTMNPEEAGGGGSALSPIGVFTHEFGHFIGLPDLYDTDYTPNTSAGMGNWALMAGGSWNGGGKVPASLNAWCKAEAGFLTLIDVTSNLNDVEIPIATYNPVAYKLQNWRTGANEYWVVENRQKVGFDLHIPGEGLCIYHIDLTAPGNTDYLNYMVGMEQADGNDDLALTSNNSGDGGDPYPGSTNNRGFHEFSMPDSRVYIGNYTEIAVWNISDSDSIMTADLDIEYSRPWLDLQGTSTTDSIWINDSDLGNGNGIIEPGETIRFYSRVKNLMRTCYNPRSTLTTDNPDIVFTTNDVNWGIDSIARNWARTNGTAPIEFHLADTIDPVIDSFYLTITTDSAVGVGGSDAFTRTYGFEMAIGSPQVLLVDDDGGADYQARYSDIIYKQRVPLRIWNKSSEGVPSVGELSGYRMVYWHTGDSTSGRITSEDIAAMKGYLDQGGNLFFSSIGGIYDMAAIDSAFLADYFKASVIGYYGGLPINNGVPGNVVGDGMRHLNQNTAPRFDIPVLQQEGTGEAAYTASSTGDICGVTSSDGQNYKTVLLSFAAEYINDARYLPLDSLLARTLSFFGGFTTEVWDGQPFASLPVSFELNQNFPNPFNPSTTILYTLVGSTGTVGQSQVDLSIYNALGQHVKTLVQGAQGPGTYRAKWDGTNHRGTKVGSGMYFYRLTRGDETTTRKMILLK